MGVLLPKVVARHPHPPPFLGSVAVGQTLSTETRVLGLADASARDGVHRGKVWLGVETRADDVPVVRYERVALLPCRGDAPGHATDLPGPDTPGPLDEWDDLVPDWDLSSLPSTDWTVSRESSLARPQQSTLALRPPWSPAHWTW